MGVFDTIRMEAELPAWQLVLAALSLVYGIYK